MMIIGRRLAPSRLLQPSLRCFSESPKADNHFGFTSVPTSEKQPLVNQVFHSVANKYDLMNDFMSLGVHRYWKHSFVNELGCLAPQRVYTHRKEQHLVRVLDVAGGTGDIAFRIL
jgi:ubiquinone/menaquinone biosynthesis C-methylase UbiE